MSVHQWIIQGVLIHWCTLSTPTHNTLTHNYCAQKLVNTASESVQLHSQALFSLFLSIELDKLHNRFECEIIDRAVLKKRKPGLVRTTNLQ